MRRMVIAGLVVLLVAGACGEAGPSAASVARDVDRLTAAWNAADGDAVRSIVDPAFTFNLPGGVDVTLDKWAGDIDEGGILKIERADDGVRNEDGTFTFLIEATNPNSRYPAAYTWQVSLQDGRIVHIDERRGTG